jgi:Mn2+/Fe2+ NRAMP family transporter
MSSVAGLPVLAGSSAYAMAEGFGFKQGLSKKIYEGKFFYIIIAGPSHIGLGINFTNVDPIAALIYTAIIDGIVDVPMLIIILKHANDKKILERGLTARHST